MSREQRLCTGNGARSVGRSCRLYLGTRTPRVLGVGGRRCSDDMTCDICKD